MHILTCFCIAVQQPVLTAPSSGGASPSIISVMPTPRGRCDVDPPPLWGQRFLSCSNTSVGGRPLAEEK